ncbi:uncharacterized protein LOC116117386 [Pistacia vera]|uniref:uncharacterized protein LOC116117386 n=1 Tax=Pistacia vera TaxID=55513 RepID=UPI001262F8D3|nr:uncharacterized protein LOC116117386 [Pistacia vera]
MALINNLRGLRLVYPAIPGGILFPKTLTNFRANFKPYFVSSPHKTIIISAEISAKPSPAQQQQQNSFTVSYLINSCGLSPEASISASQKLQLRSRERPDAVLALLRDYGFSKTQISKLIRKRPRLLLADTQKTLLPKLEFFHSIGVSQSDLTRTLSSDVTLLTRSLENQIIPSYNFLRSVLLSDEKIVSALKRTTWIFHEDYSKSLLPNVGFLSELGVPQKCIALLLTHFPEAVMQRHEEFCKTVREVKEMGFDTQKTTFVLAVHVISGKGNKSIRKRCIEAYKSWGWSEDMILAAFRKHPHCMILSEKKIMRSMDFFVNKMGLPSGMIAECPVVLFFSMEKRIIPRCSVIEVLLSKGLIKDIRLSTVLLPAEKCYLERFVMKYKEEVPELMSVYRGKVDSRGLM